MIRFVLGFVALCAVSAGAAQASDAVLGDLFQREARGLGDLPQARIERLLSEPRAHKQDFSFSANWLDNQPAPDGGPEWRCLSEALYFEARGETVKGQFAVAEVILNRVKSERFPDTLCAVINQGTGRKYQCQFTYTCDGHEEVIAEPRAFDRVAKVARAVLNGRAGNLTDGATHYHTVQVRPNWARVYTKTARIGDHLFYRHTYRTASSD
ncbi:MAG: cell wall hydrolase [Rhodobacteraceae bacterium]|nr:cell wall hydrolase [Paracoccaceae bacterium]